MKMQQFPFFASQVAANGGAVKEETTPLSKVTVISSSQPYVLQRKMQEQKMTHGETVTADISPVRVDSVEGAAVMYFCPVKELTIIETVCEGDGGEIPMQVTVEGLNIPDGFEPGLYTLRNIKLSSNGAMQVIATAETQWESCTNDKTKMTADPY